MMNLEMIKQKIRNVVLFFEILCGELVTTTQVRLYQKNEIFDYLGNCNVLIEELSIFKRNNCMEGGTPFLDLFYRKNIAYQRYIC